MARVTGLAVLLAALLLVGCSRKIGEKCTSSIDCTATTADRTCDTTQPGGYCTIFGCEADTCPSEAICVAFRLNPASAPECLDPGSQRLRRSSCLRRCEEDGDCRDGYVCADVSVAGNAWRGTILDATPEGSRVCVVPYSAAPPDPAQSSEVCGPTTEPFPALPGDGSSGAGGTSTGGSAGAGGTAGNSGAAGATAGAGGSTAGSGGTSGK